MLCTSKDTALMANGLGHLPSPASPSSYPGPASTARRQARSFASHTPAIISQPRLWRDWSQHFALTPVSCPGVTPPPPAGTSLQCPLRQQC